MAPKSHIVNKIIGRTVILQAQLLPNARLYRKALSYISMCISYGFILFKLSENFKVKDLEYKKAVALLRLYAVLLQNVAQ